MGSDQLTFPELAHMLTDKHCPELNPARKANQTSALK
jgi:hypothetical protein